MVNGKNNLTRLRPWLLSASLLLVGLTLAGCGPTDEEILGYHLVLVLVGLVLGLLMVFLGRRIARRWDQWFVCSHCLNAQRPAVPDGQIQACAVCGQTTLVTYLSKENARAVLPNDETGSISIGRRRTAVFALVLGLTTLGLMAGISAIARTAFVLKEPSYTPRNKFMHTS